MTLIIKQSGNKISGTLEANSRDPQAKKQNTKMNFNGNIYNGYMMITCLSDDSHDISFGAMILKIGNRHMTGLQIFRDLSDSKYDVFKSNVEFSLP